MDIIQLDFETQEQNIKSFVKIKINLELVDYEIIDNSIVIKQDLPPNIYMLEIHSGGKSGIIKFISAKINNIDFRAEFFNMFSLIDNKKNQTTWLTSENDKLYLPFGIPLSQWRAASIKKIPGALYATQEIYKELEIYFPTSIKLSDNFPDIIREFFEFNFDFHVHKKSLIDDPYNAIEIPYAKIDISYNEEQLANELFDHLDLLIELAVDPPQSQYNKKEAKKNAPWLKTNLVTEYNKEIHTLEEKFQIDIKKFPVLFELFQQIDYKEILYSFIGILGPYGFIAPHVDNYHDSREKFEGCVQTYIPINCPIGNYFKMHNVGLVPLDQGALLINNRHFVHAVANDTNDYRFALAIAGKF